MQQVRLWEITADRKLLEIPARYASVEQWIEDWLADDISVLDPSLMVIGRQVRTSFGGALDLLCMDGDGNLVVVELKRGQTPRDVTSQALEYSSWVKELQFDEITGIADSYPGISGTLETAFQEKFGTELPEQLNQGHRSLIVAESVDAGTDRIVRYLAEMEVPINVATVQHFEDANGRELLAQVYLDRARGGPTQGSWYVRQVGLPHGERPSGPGRREGHWRDIPAAEGRRQGHLLCPGVR